MAASVLERDSHHIALDRSTPSRAPRRRPCARERRAARRTPRPPPGAAEESSDAGACTTRGGRATCSSRSATASPPFAAPLAACAGRCHAPRAPRVPSPRRRHDAVLLASRVLRHLHSRAPVRARRRALMFGAERRRRRGRAARERVRPFARRRRGVRCCRRSSIAARCARRTRARGSASSTRVGRRGRGRRARLRAARALPGWTLDRADQSAVQSAAAGDGRHCAEARTCSTGTGPRRRTRRRRDEVRHGRRDRPCARLDMCTGRLPTVGGAGCREVASGEALGVRHDEVDPRRKGAAVPR